MLHADFIAEMSSRLVLPRGWSSKKRFPSCERQQSKSEGLSRPRQIQASVQAAVLQIDSREGKPVSKDPGLQAPRKKPDGRPPGAFVFHAGSMPAGQPAHKSFRLKYYAA